VFYGDECDAGVVADLVRLVRVGLRVRHEQAGVRVRVGAQEGADRTVAAEYEEGPALLRSGLPQRRQGEPVRCGDPGDVTRLERPDAGGDDGVRGGEAGSGVECDGHVVVGGAQLTYVTTEFDPAQLRAHDLRRDGVGERRAAGVAAEHVVEGGHAVEVPAQPVRLDQHRTQPDPGGRPGGGAAGGTAADDEQIGVVQRVGHGAIPAPSAPDCKEFFANNSLRRTLCGLWCAAWLMW